MRAFISRLCLFTCLLVACGTVPTATDEALPPAMTEQAPRLPTGTVGASPTPSPEAIATTSLADVSPTAAITSETPLLATDTVEAWPTPSPEVTASTTLADESPTAAVTGEASPVTDGGDNTVEWTDALRLTALATADFPDARSIDIAVTDSSTVYVALGMDERIFVSRSGDNGGTFTQPVQTSQDQPALVLALERPAISATDDDQVYVAWSSPERLSSIWFAYSNDGGESFGPSIRLSGSAQMETINRRVNPKDFHLSLHCVQRRLWCAPLMGNSWENNPQISQMSRGLND